MLDNGLQELSERVDHVEDASGATFESIGKAIVQLQANLADLVKKEREPVEPRSWAARATPKDWAQLVDWVDGINLSYSLQSEFQIRPCWPAHPGVVEELGGLRHAWIRATVADATAKEAGSAELTAWHDRWFWPTLQRLRQGHYRISNCSEKHTHERVRAERTDRELLPPQAAEASPMRKDTKE
ncbi:MAG: hypothetical protein ACR2P2_07945 [Nakamurella sp.]